MGDTAVPPAQFKAILELENERLLTEFEFG